MRCLHCGWPNTPGATVCSKCNSPLTAEASSEPQPQHNPTVVESVGESRMNKTVLECDVFPSAPSPRQPEPASSGQAAQCSQCGYAVRPGMTVCPRCGRPVEAAPAAPAQPKSVATKMQNGFEAEAPKRMGTFNPYMMEVQPDPSFVLEVVKRNNERKDFKPMEYEGESVLLNRANTDTDNPSITSREQAVVSHEDGKWFIEDKSDQKTTFVQAAHKVELHEGDLILMGDRLFVFHEQQ